MLCSALEPGWLETEHCYSANGFGWWFLYEASDKYILDGHHKAYAYRSLNVEPNILFIKKIDGKIEVSEDRITEALNHILTDVEIVKDIHPLTKHKRIRRWNQNRLYTS